MDLCSECSFGSQVKSEVQPPRLILLGWQFAANLIGLTNQPTGLIRDLVER